MNKLRAFTIVELLVVIVVIGILASVTILSYTGITNKAIASSLQSDLTNASKQLDLFQIDYGYYPSTIDCTIPDSNTNKCIRTNPANSFTYLPGLGTNPTTYTLTATHTDSTTNYTITNNSPPIATAPEGPVADWLAMPRGDHYGSFYDLISKQYATVTRSTPKTIYDPLTNKVYDVPANTLGIRPRSDGKAGYEAEVEEGRTNLIKNSQLLDDNGDNFSNFWPTSIYAGMVYKIESDDNDNRMHVSFDNNNTNWVYEQVVVDYPNIGDVYTYSAEMETLNISPGTYISIEVVCVGGSTPYFSQSSPSGGTSAKKRYSFTFTVPTGTTQIKARFRRVSGNPISGDAWWSRPQFEKGGFATSYIRTVDDIAVTRLPDKITIPSTFWNANYGTVLGVAYRQDSTTINNAVYSAFNGPNYVMANDGWGSNDFRSVMRSNLGASSSYNISRTLTYAVLGNFWNSSSHTAIVNSSLANQSTSAYPLDSFTNVSIGSLMATASYWNGSIQRLTVYDRVLSQNQLNVHYNEVKDGPL